MSHKYYSQEGQLVSALSKMTATRRRNVGEDRSQDWVTMGSECHPQCGYHHRVKHGWSEDAAETEAWQRKGSVGYRKMSWWYVKGLQKSAGRLEGWPDGGRGRRARAAEN